MRQEKRGYVYDYDELAEVISRRINAFVSRTTDPYRITPIQARELAVLAVRDYFTRYSEWRSREVSFNERLKEWYPWFDWQEPHTVSEEMHSHALDQIEAKVIEDLGEIVQEANWNIYTIQKLGGSTILIMNIGDWRIHQWEQQNPKLKKGKTGRGAMR